MDGTKLKELESMLEAAGVPRSLWPRYLEKEEHRQLRRRIRDDDEFRRALAEQLKEAAAEKRRRRDFSMLVMLLVWLLKQDSKDSTSFAQRCFSALRASPSTRRDGELCERMTACLTLAKYPAEAHQACTQGAQNKADQTFPLNAAARHIERAEQESNDRETQKKAEADKIREQLYPPETSIFDPVPIDPDLAGPEW